MGSDLQWMSREGVYASAVVFGLDPQCEAAVYRARRLLSVDTTQQLRPHLTLCHLGVADSASVQRIWATIAAEPWPELYDAVVRGVGFFGLDGDGVSTNVHLEIERSPDFHELHRRVLKAARRVSVFQPGDYVGDQWVPHVSVVDGIGIDEGLRRRVAELPWPQSVRLAPLVVISRRVDPVEIRGLGSSDRSARAGSSWGHHAAASSDV